MGGIGSAVARSACALAQAGNDVHVFTLTLPPDAHSQLPAGLTIHQTHDLAARVQGGMVSSELAASVHAGGDGIYRLSLASILCHQLKCHHAQAPFDVVEPPEVEALGLPLLLDPHFDAPVITHLHCCTALARKFNGDPTTADKQLLSALEFAAIHLSDALCAPTNAVVQATRTCCRIDGDVAIIPHAFASAAEFAPPGDEGPILFVGRLERLKGVEAIADALNLFLPKYPTATFRFIGPDTSTAPGHASMQQWILSRLRPEIRPRVEFAGELPAGEIARQWQRARFGVMPSLWENFSMALCEAMSAGRTVIVAHGTGSVELIADSALITPPNSPARLAAAMEHLWTDRNTLHRFSRSAYERIGAFAPDTIAQRRVEFYRRVISEFRRSTRNKLASLPPACAAAILPALVRMTSSLSGIPADLQTPGTRLLKVMDEVKDSTGSPAQILLYGAGKHTARVLSERHVWESRNHRVVGIIDDHPRFAQSPVYLDLPVQSLDRATARLLAGSQLPPVVLSTDTYEDQFWNQSAPLRDAGVPVYRLYS